MVPNITKQTTCTTSELAMVLGVSDRRIQQLVKEGLITPIGRNEYKLSETVQSYIKTVQGKQKSEYQEERTKLTKTNREKAEIELQLLRNEVHHSEDVKRVMYDMLGAFRSRLLAIPQKVAPAATVETDLLKMQNLLKAEIYDALTELSEYDPGKFYRQSEDAVSKDAEKDT
jgi:phage terminase Nu1 subunit (DNA packaging protein)